MSSDIANLDLQVLEKLLSLSGTHNVHTLAEEFRVTPLNLIECLKFLDNFGRKVELSVEDVLIENNLSNLSDEEIDHARLKVNFKKSEEPAFTLNISLSEWLSFELLKNKILEQTSKDCIGMTFYHWLEQQYKNKKMPSISLAEIDNIQCLIKKSNLGELINVLEESFEAKKLVNLTKLNQSQASQINVLPRRLVYIDGKVNIIFEYLKEHFLDHLALDSIRSIEMSSQSADKFFTKFEIEDYISSLRFISENCVRLILKVNNEKVIADFPKYHYLGNPCKIINPLGDIIWAAHIEINHQIFDWLYQCRGYFDIIDPINIKEEFRNFCKVRDKSAA